MDELGKLSLTRLVVVICILLGGMAVTYFGSRSTVANVGAVVNLESFPKQIGQWSYFNANTFNTDILEMLGTDNYIDYYYRSENKREIEILISYYASMHESKQFHSPKNCMLGSGWEALDSRQLTIQWRDKPVPVNYMLVRRGAQNLNVVYWVQGRGRLMASEYNERFFRVVDTLVKRRTDAAFIRVSMLGEMEHQAQDIRLLKELVEQVATEVDAYLPK